MQIKKKTFCLKISLRNTNSACRLSWLNRALALCTSVESTDCLLDGGVVGLSVKVEVAMGRFTVHSMAQKTVWPPPLPWHRYLQETVTIYIFPNIYLILIHIVSINIVAFWPIWLPALTLLHLELKDKLIRFILFKLLYVSVRVNWTFQCDLVHVIYWFLFVLNMFRALGHHQKYTILSTWKGPLYSIASC
jgi:hypothetical protein